MNSKQTTKLIVRNAKIKDVRDIIALGKKIYPNQSSYSTYAIQGQINNYPEGQFIAEYEGRLVGYCSSIRISEKQALRSHNWSDITGNGYGSTHNKFGEFLYGVEVFVDPDYRGMKIGERFYTERKKLCRYHRMKGIVFAGRLPLLHKRLKKIGTVEKYVEMVKNKKVRDPVLGFQLRNGFEIIGVLKNYLPSDKESLGYAAHLVWYNPEEISESNKVKESSGRMPDTVRVASVQYMQRGIKSFDEFKRIVEYFVDVVADYHSDFVVFPEFFTLQLLSIENEAIPPNEGIATLTKYTSPLKEYFHELAIKYNINIVAGSHPTHTDSGSVQNISYLFLRDGTICQQAKLHPTPNERYWWNIEGGEQLSVFNTDCGPVGILICYDCEFPELARHLANQGVNLIFVPFCTDERQSYLRVRYCAQARAVENQCYVVMSGNVGNLPRVHNMDIQYAQSCILSPCDFSFSRDGIAADTTPNVETVAFADLRIESLYAARHDGTVQNLRDRRHDLYSINWKVSS